MNVLFIRAVLFPVSVYTTGNAVSSISTNKYINNLQSSLPLTLTSLKLLLQQKVAASNSYIILVKPSV